MAMETENSPSGASTLAKTVAMLRRATGLLKELKDRMEDVGGGDTERGHSE
jgi:hypothetical protein